ncbi:C6 transcription factor [Phlyctema vagabunda]|uniref:C6 transcription factor n=1 Tax=Phlyctema vagabunda TaxID=108571 RepID=A0ABR4P280_9HELO
MSTEHTPLLSGGPSRELSPNPQVRIPPITTDLTRFRMAIGINSLQSTSITPCDVHSLRRNSSGIYRSVLNAQRRFLFQYHFIEAVYYVALLSQLVIGATLASLGPLSSLHPRAITVLGIVNSCIAGIIAFFKGQGLPDRLRKDEFEMRKVQDFIEQCECRLAVQIGADEDDDEDDRADVEDLVNEVFERYNVARDTAEMNRPSTYAHQVESGERQKPRARKPRTPSDTIPTLNLNLNERAQERMGGDDGRQSRIVVGKGVNKSLEIS